MERDHLRSVVVVGQGVAAWMSAAVLCQSLGARCKICVLETGRDAGLLEPEAGTLPQIKILHAILGVHEADFVRRTQATFRLGGAFRDWGEIGEFYFHPFGDVGANLESVSFRHHWLRLKALGDVPPLSDFSLCAMAARNKKFAPPASDKRSVLSTLDYAYHVDSAAYADFLRSLAIARGAESRRCDRIGADFTDAGAIAALVADGERIEGDLFIDATGSTASLIEGVLHAGFEDWRQWLPCDRVVSAAAARLEDLPPYSVSTALTAGWRWTVPLMERTGLGYGFSSAHASDEEAAAALTPSPRAADLRFASFTSGRRKEFWSQNVVAIGSAGCALEPLDAVNIHIIQTGLMRLLSLLPDRTVAPNERAEYNRLMIGECERIRDFLILHYAATRRHDTPFWNACRDMALPDSLAYKMRLFQSRGRVVLYDEETFEEADWAAVFLGQGITPRRYDPLADTLDPQQIRLQLQRMRGVIRQGADSLPLHRAYLEKFLRHAGARP
jgi:tryptophan 7-halogenase